MIATILTDKENMKTAILYLHDNGNSSAELYSQVCQLESYCKEHEIEILDVFYERHTANMHNRPGRTALCRGV